MSEHYYSEHPSAKSEPRNVHFHVRGIEMNLRTDAGVFSKSGLDFGTRLLIETVELPVGALVVDLGCGYGAVGTTLARIYPETRWVMLDVNERAVELALKNTESLRNRVRVLHQDGLAGCCDEQPNAILLNPPIRAGKSVVYRLFEESSIKLCSEGTLWVVIHKKHGADSARKFLEGLFPVVEMSARKSGYQVFRCST